MGRPQGTCKVLVSRIQAGTDKKEIHSLLSTFGNIISHEVRPNQDKDRSGFYRLLVTYEATEQAQQAVRNLSNYRYGGSILRLEYYNPNFGDMNGGPNPHHNKRHNGHMGGRGHAGMPNGGHAAGHGGHHGGRGGGSMMNGGHMNGSLRSPMGGPGYYSGHVGHPPPKELPVRMLVPSDMVGAIIGKSGATITSITQQSQARVEVNKKNAGGIYAEGQMDKVINIYGANEACSQACKRILEVMLQESQQPAANTMNGGGASRRRDEPITLRLLAHNNLVGRVIGRSGMVIKKIMEETNAQINVSQMSDPRERVIVIRGNLEEMSKAQQQVTTKMRQCYEQDLQQAMMGGYGGPDMGPPPPQPIPPALPYAFHRPPLPPPLSHSYHGGPNGHPGGPHHPPNYGPPLPYGHLGMSSPPGHFYPIGDGSVEVVHVWVPSCTVGAIIGTSGSSIREMIRASGCSMKVSQTNAKDESRTKVDESAQPKQNGSENSVETPSSSSATTEGNQSTKREGGNVSSLPNPSDRRVTVTGSAEAQWKAQCLLYRKVFLEAVQHLDLNPDVANDPQIRQGHLRVEINVPSSQVGRIIGKGGLTVKDMQRQSRAIIKLPEETSKRAGSPDEEVETPLYIIGDFYAVQAAQRRIRALIARNSQGGPTTNGSQAKKQVDEAATQKVEGDCDQSESQC